MFGTLALLAYLLWYWNPAYRYDEYLVAVARTNLSWEELLRVIVNTDPAPGPLYLLMKPWTALSSDPWWTRLPSVIAMAVAVGGLVAFTQAAVDTRTAVFAGLLMIVLPVNSQWAQDNRMYAPAAACVVLAVLSWWRSANGGSRRWSVGYGAAVVAMGLFHLYTLTVIPALVLAACWVSGSRRSTMVRTIVPPVIALIVLVPHIYLNASHPTGSPSNPAVSLESLAAMANVGAPLREAGGPQGVLPALAITLTTVILAVGGTVWSWQFQARRAVVALGVGWVLIPLLCFVGARALTEVPTMVPRYIVFAIPGGCILAALGLEAIHHRWRPGAIISLCVVGALAAPQQIAVRSADAHSPDAHLLGQLLRQPELARLPIVATTPSLELMVGASTYPNRVITPATAVAQPVAVVVTRPSASGAAPRIPYTGAGSPWRAAVQCTLRYSGDRDVLLKVVALPGASLPSGNPEALARELNVAVPGSHCVASP